MDLTAEQTVIAEQIDRFIAGYRPQPGVKPYFCYHGLAGTGKSYLLAHIKQKYPDAMLCAFTGKAASVIQRKSGYEASTIHKLLYQYIGKNRETGRPRFMPKLGAGELRGQLILVDESSTVDDRLAGDLFRTGATIVACGDNGQLPPVAGSSVLEADAYLLEVHRQAWDSAIIRQAHAIRGGGIYQDDGPDFRVTHEVSARQINAANVILCYRNATRHQLNRLVREHRNLNDGIAHRGELVMGLRNAPEWGILNGAVYMLARDHFAGDGSLIIISEWGVEIEIDRAFIDDFEAPIIEASDAEQDRVNPFAWAYACTVHKAQGSEYDNVIINDEYDREDHRSRWLYTAVTRASRSVIVQRSWGWH